ASMNNGAVGLEDADLARRLLASDVVAFGADEGVQWERSLRRIVEIGTAEPWEFSPESGGTPSRGELLRHCRWIERSIGIARRRFGAGNNTRSRRAWLMSAGAVTIVIGIAAWVLPRGGSASAVWRGAYYANTDATGEPIIRNDEDVFFDWGDNSPLPGIPAD